MTLLIVKTQNNIGIKKSVAFNFLLFQKHVVAHFYITDAGKK